MNKQRIDPVDPSTSSGSNKKNFDILKSALGFIPNMALVMAQAPAVLDGYMGLNGSLFKGRLGKRLREASSDGLNVKQPGLTQWLVGKSGEIPERGRLVVDAGGKAIGIYRLDGALYAYENICPHQGGRVCQGLIVSRVLELIDEKGVSRGNRFDDNELHVVCPWHGFEYDIRTGRHAGGVNISLKAVPVLEREGEIYVTI
jgi:nitrite reductase/ring-hydroxylating ferredoxin subunit